MHESLHNLNIDNTKQGIKLSSNLSSYLEVPNSMPNNRHQHNNYVNSTLSVEKKNEK